MIRKSAIVKLSNPYLFRQIKKNLHGHRKFSEIEGRIILKQNRDRLFHDPKTRNFRFFWKLAREAFEREDYNEAFILINKTMDLLPQSSVSKSNLNNASNLGNTRGPNDLDTARIYELAGNIYINNHQIQGSINLLERSLGILINTLGEDTIYSEKLVCKLALSYLMNYRGKEAIFYFLKFLKIKKAQFPDPDEIDVLVMGQIGLAWNYYKSPIAAIRIFKEVIRLSEKSLRKYYLAQRYILGFIGSFYLEARKRNQSKKYYRKCLNLIVKCYSDNKIPKYYIYNILIDYYCAIGMYDRSVCIAKKAIKNLMESKKENLLEIINIYQSISRMYNAKNDDKRFAYYFRKYLDLLKKVVGPKHPMFLYDSIFYTGILSIFNGKYRQSLKKIRKIKEGLNEVFKLNSNIKAYYKLAKGEIYTSLNWHRKSSIKLEEAKKLIIGNFGEYHPLYISCCVAIGDNLQSQEYFDEALTIYKTVLESVLRVYSYFHIQSAGIIRHIAIVFLQKGKFSSSLEYFKRALDIFKELNLRDTYETKITYLNIGELYLEQGKYKEFHYYLNKSLNIQTENNFGKHYYTHRSFEVIGKYLDQTGNFEALRRISMKRIKLSLNSDQYNHSEAIMTITSLARCEIVIGRMNGSVKSSFAKANKMLVLSTSLYSKLIEKRKISEKNLLIVEIYKLRADLYRVLGKNEDCLSSLRYALNLVRHFYKKNDFKMLYTYLKIIEVLYNTKRFYEGVQICKRALKIQLNTYENSWYISKLYNAIAVGYFRLDRIDESLIYAKKSLRINKKLYTKTDFNLKYSYYHLGLCYSNKQEQEQALKYYKIAIFKTDASRDKIKLDSCILNNMGAIYGGYKQKLHKALGIFRVCAENAKTNKFSKEWIQGIMHNLQEIERVIEIQSEPTIGGNNNEQNPQGIDSDSEMLNVGLYSLEYDYLTR